MGNLTSISRIAHINSVGSGQYALRYLSASIDSSRMER